MEKYVIIDMVTGEYLAKRFMRGFYLTPMINDAIQTKTEDEARAHLSKQNVKSGDAFKIDTISVS
ncbi:MAG: hypothetical protein K5987_02780 [Lachnospiraceae bacterium]|nr:hypothetical protein [Lachnospiraceae bacterium]